MKKEEETEDLERLLNEKILQFANFKKAIPKLIFIIVIAAFLAPFAPHKRMIKLLAEKGYWRAILFGAPVLMIVAVIVIYIQHSNRKEEIKKLQKKVNIIKRNNLLGL